MKRVQKGTFTIPPVKHARVHINRSIDKVKVQVLRYTYQLQFHTKVIQRQITWMKTISHIICFRPAKGVDLIYLKDCVVWMVNGHFLHQRNQSKLHSPTILVKNEHPTL